MLIPTRTILLFFIAVSAVFLDGCSLEKRHYRKGFFVEWNNRDASKAVVHNDSTHSEKVVITPGDVSLIPVEEDSFLDTESTVQENSLSDPVAQRNIRTQPVLRVRRAMTLISRATPKDEPADLDRPNKKILWLMLLAVIISLLVLFIFLPGADVMPFILLRFFPAIGLVLFGCALLLRKKVLNAVIAGAKGDDYLLSGLYHRFALPLYLFFGAALAGMVGWLLLFGAGPMVFAGGILIESALILGVVMTIFLAALGFMYLTKWRRQGEGRKKPWENRPKDG